MPFAQTDVMNTVLSGVDPHLEDIFAINFKKTIMKYGGIIADIVEPVNKSIADSIRGLDISSLINEFTNPPPTIILLFGKRNISYLLLEQ